MLLVALAMHTTFVVEQPFQTLLKRNHRWEWFTNTVARATCSDQCCMISFLLEPLPSRCRQSQSNLGLPDPLLDDASRKRFAETNPFIQPDEHASYDGQGQAYPEAG